MAPVGEGLEEPTSGRPLPLAWTPQDSNSHQHPRLWRRANRRRGGGKPIGIGEPLRISWLAAGRAGPDAAFKTEVSSAETRGRPSSRGERKWGLPSGASSETQVRSWVSAERQQLAKV